MSVDLRSGPAPRSFLSAGGTGRSSMKVILRTVPVRPLETRAMLVDSAGRCGVSPGNRICTSETDRVE